MFETLKEWDRELLIYLNNLGSESFDLFWIFLTQIESWIFLFILFVLFVFYYYRGKKGIIVFVATVLLFWITHLVTGITKELVERLRPNNTESLSEFIRVLQHPESYSFFSGHASSSMAVTTFIVLMLRKFNKWIYLAYIWPLFFMYSRIYVGVHYPSDIIVGALVGMFLAIFGYRLSQRVVQRI